LLYSQYLAGCCPPEPPRYVLDPPRAETLPASAKTLIEESDRLLRRYPLGIQDVERARQALAKALQFVRSFDVHWRLSRACFLLSQKLANREEKLRYALVGLEHAIQGRRLVRDRVEPHYYEALNRANVAEAKGSLKLVKPMMAAARKATLIDEAYDNAGPLVVQGKVYLTAPPWPMSVGNTEKAVEMLARAVRLAPTAMNKIFLGQAYYHDEQYVRSRKVIRKALKAAGSRLDPRWRKEARDYLRRLRAELGTEQ
jgi:tetratricopeptide (TPR) repeat protein